MSDRELLELAAKAAGMEHMRWSGPAGLSRMLDPTRPETTGSIGGYWNPLADDGDAMRLAVKLRFKVTVGNSITMVESPRIADVGVEFYEGADAATRRAIVRAAAWIGQYLTTTEANPAVCGTGGGT